MNQSGINIGPLARRPSVYWYISFRCNLHCVHCWVNASPSSDVSHDLNDRDAQETAKRIGAFAPESVTISGGEPLLRRDMANIIDTLADSGIDRLNIETNAMLIRSDVIEALRRAQALGTNVTVATSLDGGTESAHDAMRGPGSFRKALHGIQRLVKANISTEIQCVVTKLNVDSLKPLAQLGQQMGIRLLKFVFVNPVGRALEGYEHLAIPHAKYVEALDGIGNAIRYYPGMIRLKMPPAAVPPHLLQLFSQETHQTWTGCAFPVLGIVPDGSVTVCALTRDREELRFGHVLQGELESMWLRGGGPRRKAQYYAATLEGVCGDCLFRRQCKGSCRVDAYEREGSFTAPYPLCASLDREGLFPNIYRTSYLATMKRRRQEGKDNVARAQA